PQVADGLTYDDCLNAAKEWGVSADSFGHVVQGTCMDAEEAGIVGKFRDCLGALPKNLGEGVPFFTDCLDRSRPESHASQIYPSCLKEIATLKIESIGTVFNDLAYNASADGQCTKLVSCLKSQEQANISFQNLEFQEQNSPSRRAVSSCAAQVPLREQRGADEEVAQLSTQKQPEQPQEIKPEKSGASPRKIASAHRPRLAARGHKHYKARQAYRRRLARLKRRHHRHYYKVTNQL
ncbi:MAG: hypothetical protein C5B49_10795, partial [Bdellovibrio sp.]